MASPETKVYRLRGIPEHLDRLGVAQLIRPFLPSEKLEDITVASLALSCGFWSRSPTKTATLTLRSLPDLVRAAPGAGEWQLPILALPKPLILDDTFYGLTPLNEVSEFQHRYDCIVISGLAGHPMGSWQPRGNDKSFSWIRDSLPELVPGVRFILYGYDTKLVGSKSFQTVPDLAINLINELKSGGWSSPSAKGLIFLAHSLGGVVLKQCLCMLADSGVSHESVLQKTKGAVFFGVPSEGMSIEDIHSMLGDQPNKHTLATDISDKSDFLSSLEKRISGISHIRGMRFFWAYETQTTPTVEYVNDTYRRSGPEAILVSRESATGNRWASDPSSTIQIDANHSDMVKFSSESHMIGPIACKLRDVVGSDHRDLGHDSTHLATGNGLIPAKSTITQALVNNNTRDIEDLNRNLDLWDFDEVLQSLCAPERDERLEQIDDSAGCSFEWVFEKPGIGLSNWLQKGDGLYWVSGRPASGKSTFMKFLHNDKRTSELLRGWYSRSEHVNANFFFHYRGTLIQKSFEGLLRSILSQILEQAPGTSSMFQSIFQHHYQHLLGAESLGDLYTDLEELFMANEMILGANFRNNLPSLLECGAPTKLFRTLVVQRLRSNREEAIDWKQFEKLIISQMQDLLQSLRQNKLLEACSGIYPRGWSNEMKDGFLSGMPDWLEAVDLKERLLRLGETSIAQRAPFPTRTRARERFAQDVENIVRRHHSRLNVRQSTQRSIWTLDNLQRALFKIINQESIDLDMCLFIDALDEYDGQPEFIADFLEEITQQRTSRTRVKILFSSRPWDKFTDAFGDCPGFRIHEHTENDIRELCYHVIQAECPASRELFLLVEEIVKQAGGVFLWVKLVLLDLSKIASAAVRRGDTGALSEELQEVLKNLPRDLVDYYSTIVERIPQCFRREAFCLLEVVAKGDRVYLKDIPMILSCLNFTHFDERSQIIESLDEPDSRALAISLRIYTGGLIEMHGKSSNPTLQLLHQTAVDFIQLPEFKNNILRSGARAMDDNGHTFLAKLKLLRISQREDGTFCLDGEFLEHAERSEETTGTSLYSFFSGTRHLFSPFSLLSNKESFFLSQRLRERDESSFVHKSKVHIIAAAFCANLGLFIEEALESNPRIFSEPLACCVIAAIVLYGYGYFDQKEALQMLEYLTSHDFPFEKHINCCLSGALCLMREDRDGFEQEDVEPLVLKFTSLIKDPNISCYIPRSFHDTWDDPVSKGALHIIHLAPYRIVKDLLERNANPNMKGEYGHTPLDLCALGYYTYGGAIGVSKLMLLLIQHGGLLNRCTKQEWKEKVRDLSGFNSLDVSLFKRLGYPKWIEKEHVLSRRSMYRGIVGLFRSKRG
ncbi:hypothetical protein M440DRAFT_1405803 [Trichoderma longibrachiatum ATCC 18648]|uniref:Nephrocystin 3-like N-terminal domain-containing protein n=1 Tax=Trichoderma longibrachiatum ATCC 18648 TaxID=983965 RepID=A0A2T4BRV5_TRILO|nr:hypothetical protein M440DRAFT_1405803 [Trichoderma longibrachiatum ATCC 18648]